MRYSAAYPTGAERCEELNHGIHGRKSGMELVFEDETYAIRGAIYEVYKNSGSGFLEAVYQEG